MNGDITRNELAKVLTDELDNNIYSINTINTQLAEIPNQIYITEKAKQVDLDNTNNNVALKANNTDFNRKTTDKTVTGAINELKNKITEVDNNKVPNATADNLQTQINNLVLGAVGNGNNAEVIQARSNYTTLLERLNSMVNSWSDSINYLTDLNVATINTIARYNSNINNSANGEGGTVFTFAQTNDTLAQITITQSNKFYYRIKWGSSWTEWKTKENQILSITDNTSTGMNDLKMNSITRFDSNVTNNPSLVGGTAITFAKSNDTLAQIVINQRGELYQRIKWGSTWSEWKRMSDYSLANISVLKSLGVIGDSWASGVVTPTDIGATNYTNYSMSWAQIIARDAGITAYNFSMGGETCKSWLSDTEHGLSKLLGTSKCSCYIITLGINDATDYRNGNLVIGTESDIGTDSNSFYGYYSKIISSILSYSDKSKIIIFTTANITDYGHRHINEAIVNIGNHYKLPVVTLYDNSLIDTEYFKDFTITGHPTLIGYSYLANAYRSIIEKVMSNNQMYFNDLGQYF